jgi:hypothetical protein
MVRKKIKGYIMQWLTVALALLGFLWNGVKDYQKGDIKIPVISTEKKELTKQVYPVQYCLMAYDPNNDKVWYQHEDGKWYEYAPPQRRYAATPQHDQNKSQTTVGTAYGASTGSVGHYVR